MKHHTRLKFRTVAKFKKTGKITKRLLHYCQHDKELLYRCFPALAPPPSPIFLDASKLSYYYYAPETVRQFNAKSVLWNKLK